MLYYFPIWQGSGSEDSIYQGASYLHDLLAETFSFKNVSPFSNSSSPRKKGIVNYQVLLDNLSTYHDALEADKPDKVFTLGGDCSLEIVPGGYLNDRYDGDVTFLWFDAHGDINSPASSPSGTLHGMPLRTLLGEGDSRLHALVDRKITPNQIRYVGVRDLDASEEEYIARNEITVLWASMGNELEERMPGVLSHCNPHIYVHVDLDVVDPQEFPDVRVSAQNGLTKKSLMSALSIVGKEKTVIGGSILEYTGESSKDADFIKELLVTMQAC